MVYNMLNNAEPIVYDILGSAPPKAVIVKYNNIDIATIAGPTPMIDISKSIQSNTVGYPEAEITKISLNGKIVKVSGATSGISAVTSGIQDITKLFKNNPNQSLEVICGHSNHPLITYSGVKLISLDFPTSNDNWIFTSDFTVVLEHIQPVISGDFYVKDTSETWNIEPLEDYIHTDMTIRDIQERAQNHNPFISPKLPPDSKNILTTTQKQTTIDIKTIPQFKISRTLSAVGYTSGVGTGIYNSAYLNAIRWVNTRSNNVINGLPLGAIKLGDYNASNMPIGVGTYLYNHIRTTNFSQTEGKYEVVDTWLAMPSAITFLEDYTIDVNTDDKYIHNVTVAGSIRGLYAAPISGYVSETGTLINISGSNKNYTLNSPISLDTTLSPQTRVSTLYKNKYDNAVGAWISGVKPYLYTRASMVMNSSQTKDRDKGYIPTNTRNSNIATPPSNPIFSKHTLLNFIPISTSETHNPRKGTIDYSYTFHNKFNVIQGVLFENIAVNDTGPTDVINEAFVLGRALGPVLQNLGTRTSSKKSVVIEVGVVPPTAIKDFFLTADGCPLYTGGSIYNGIQSLVNGFAPFGPRNSPIFDPTRSQMPGQVYISEDNHSWNPTEGRFSRSVSWVYQHCTNGINYLNH